MRKFHFRRPGELVRMVEEVEHEYFMSYQDGLITVCLRHLTEQQKLQILRLIIKQTKGKILEDVPMQLPKKQNEEKFLRICKEYGKYLADEKSLYLPDTY